MKKTKYIIITIMLSILNMQPISAACTQEEINNFKRIEDDYTVKYEIDKSTHEYTLYLERSKPSLYDFIIYTNQDIKCEKTSDTQKKCSSFKTGEYKLTINGKTETCDTVLKTINLKLPKYNKLSEDPLCEGIEEFVLCNPTYEKEIDYDSFVSRINTYKKTKEKQQETNQTTEETEVEEKNEFVIKVTTFVQQYWIEIIVIAVFVILVIITIITTKSLRKSRYLE